MATTKKTTNAPKKTRKMKPKKFFLVFPDETVEEAIEAHDEPYTSIEAAVNDVYPSKYPRAYMVYSEEGIQVHSGIKCSQLN